MDICVIFTGAVHAVTTSGIFGCLSLLLWLFYVNARSWKWLIVYLFILPSGFFFQVYRKFATFEEEEPWWLQLLGPLPLNDPFGICSAISAWLLVFQVAIYMYCRPKSALLSSSSSSLSSSSSAFALLVLAILSASAYPTLAITPLLVFGGLIPGLFMIKPHNHYHCPHNSRLNSFFFSVTRVYTGVYMLAFWTLSQTISEEVVNDEDIIQFSGLLRHFRDAGKVWPVYLSLLCVALHHIIASLSSSLSPSSQSHHQESTSSSRTHERSRTIDARRRTETIQSKTMLYVLLQSIFSFRELGLVLLLFAFATTYPSGYSSACLFIVVVSVLYNSILLPKLRQRTTRVQSDLGYNTGITSSKTLIILLMTMFCAHFLAAYSAIITAQIQSPAVFNPASTSFSFSPFSSSSPPPSKSLSSLTMEFPSFPVWMRIVGFIPIANGGAFASFSAVILLYLWGCLYKYDKMTPSSSSSSSSLSAPSPGIHNIDTQHMRPSARFDFTSPRYQHQTVGESTFDTADTDAGSELPLRQRRQKEGEEESSSTRIPATTTNTSIGEPRASRHRKYNVTTTHHNPITAPTIISSSSHPSSQSSPKGLRFFFMHYLKLFCSLFLSFFHSLTHTLLPSSLWIITLLSLYVVALAHIDIPHALYVLLFALLSPSPGVRKKYWFLLVIYSACIVCTYFILHLIAVSVSYSDRDDEDEDHGGDGLSCGVRFKDKFPPWAVTPDILDTSSSPAESGLWGTSFAGNIAIFLFSSAQGTLYYCAPPRPDHDNDDGQQVQYDSTPKASSTASVLLTTTSFARRFAFMHRWFREWKYWLQLGPFLWVGVHLLILLFSLFPPLPWMTPTTTRPSSSNQQPPLATIEIFSVCTLLLQATIIMKHLSLGVCAAARQHVLTMSMLSRLFRIQALVQTIFFTARYLYQFLVLGDIFDTFWEEALGMKGVITVNELGLTEYINRETYAGDVYLHLLPNVLSLALAIIAIRSSESALRDRSRRRRTTLMTPRGRQVGERRQTIRREIQEGHGLLNEEQQALIGGASHGDKISSRSSWGFVEDEKLLHPHPASNASNITIEIDSSKRSTSSSPLPNHILYHYHHHHHHHHHHVRHTASWIGVFAIAGATIALSAGISLLVAGAGIGIGILIGTIIACAIIIEVSAHGRVGLWRRWRHIVQRSLRGAFFMFLYLVYLHSGKMVLLATFTMAILHPNVLGAVFLCMCLAICFRVLLCRVVPREKRKKELEAQWKQQLRSTNSQNDEEGASGSCSSFTATPTPAGGDPLQGIWFPCALLSLIILNMKFLFQVTFFRPSSEWYSGGSLDAEWWGFMRVVTDSDQSFGTVGSIRELIQNEVVILIACILQRWSHDARFLLYLETKQKEGEVRISQSTQEEEEDTTVSSRRYEKHQHHQDLHNAAVSIDAIFTREHAAKAMAKDPDIRVADALLTVSPTTTSTYSPSLPTSPTLLPLKVFLKYRTTMTITQGFQKAVKKYIVSILRDTITIALLLVAAISLLDIWSIFYAIVAATSIGEKKDIMATCSSRCKLLSRHVAVICLLVISICIHYVGSIGWHPSTAPDIWPWGPSNSNLFALYFAGLGLGKVPLPLPPQQQLPPITATFSPIFTLHLVPSCVALLFACLSFREQKLEEAGWSMRQDTYSAFQQSQSDSAATTTKSHPEEVRVNSAFLPAQQNHPVVSYRPVYLCTWDALQIFVCQYAHLFVAATLFFAATIPTPLGLLSGGYLIFSLRFLLHRPRSASSTTATVTTIPHLTWIGKLRQSPSIVWIRGYNVVCIVLYFLYQIPWIPPPSAIAQQHQRPKLSLFTSIPLLSENCEFSWQALIGFTRLLVTQGRSDFVPGCTPLFPPPPLPPAPSSLPLSIPVSDSSCSSPFTIFYGGGLLTSTCVFVILNIYALYILPSPAYQHMLLIVKEDEAQASKRRIEFVLQEQQERDQQRAEEYKERFEMQSRLAFLAENVSRWEAMAMTVEQGNNNNNIEGDTPPLQSRASLYRSSPSPFTSSSSLQHPSSYSTLAHLAPQPPTQITAEQIGANTVLITWNVKMLSDASRATTSSSSSSSSSSSQAISESSFEPTTPSPSLLVLIEYNQIGTSLLGNWRAIESPATRFVYEEGFAVVHLPTETHQNADTAASSGWPTTFEFRLACENEEFTGPYSFPTAPVTILPLRENQEEDMKVYHDGHKIALEGVKMMQQQDQQGTSIKTSAATTTTTTIPATSTTGASETSQENSSSPADVTKPLSARQQKYKMLGEEGIHHCCGCENNGFYGWLQWIYDTLEGTIARRVDPFLYPHIVQRGQARGVLPAGGSTSMAGISLPSSHSMKKQEEAKKLTDMKSDTTKNGKKKKHPTTHVRRVLSRLRFLLILILAAIASSTQGVAAVAILAHMCVYASALALIFPSALFFYGAIEYPRPSTRLWTFGIRYIITIIMLKYIFQLPVFCMQLDENDHWIPYLWFQCFPRAASSNDDTDSKTASSLSIPLLPVLSILGGSGEDTATTAADDTTTINTLLKTTQRYVQPLEVFGITKYTTCFGGNGFLTGIAMDVILLSCLLLHKYTLQRKGMWREEKYDDDGNDDHVDGTVPLQHGRRIRSSNRDEMTSSLSFLSEETTLLEPQQQNPMVVNVVLQDEKEDEEEEKVEEKEGHITTTTNNNNIVMSEEEGNSLILSVSPASSPSSSPVPSTLSPQHLRLISPVNSATPRSLPHAYVALPSRDNEEEEEEEGEEEEGGRRQTTASNAAAETLPSPPPPPLLDSGINLKHTASSKLQHESSSLTTCVQRMQKYFRKITDPRHACPQKPGRDLYVWCFLIEFVIFLYTILFYSTFSTPELEAAGVGEALAYNQFSGGMVLAVMAIMALMVADRVCYLLRAHLSKFIFHVMTTVFVHLSLFFILPISTDRSFKFNSSLVVFYILWYIYLLLSSSQLWYGYAHTSPRDSLLHGHLGYNPPVPLLLNIYLAIPFLGELRYILDWVCTRTCLDIFAYLRLETAHRELFLAQCAAIGKLRNKATVHGWKAQAREYKCWCGIGLFGLLCGVILFPAVLFSTLNPTLRYNDVNAASASLSLRAITTITSTSSISNAWTLWSTSFASSIQDTTANEFSWLRENVTGGYSVEDSSRGSSSGSGGRSGGGGDGDGDGGDGDGDGGGSFITPQGLPSPIRPEWFDLAQTISMPSTPETSWDISAPSLRNLLLSLYECAKYTTTTITTTTAVMVDFHSTFSRPGPTEYEILEGQSSITLSPTECRSLYETLQNATSLMASLSDENLRTRNTSQRTVLLSSVYPLAMRLPATSSPVKLGKEMQDVYIQLHFATQTAGSSLSSSIPPKKMMMSWWWSVEMNRGDPSSSFSASLSPMDTSGPQFYTISDKIAPSLLISGLLGSSYSVLAVYVTVILAVGRLLRGGLGVSTRDIMFQEIPDATPLLELCEGIRMAHGGRQQAVVVAAVPKGVPVSATSSTSSSSSANFSERSNKITPSLQDGHHHYQHHHQHTQQQQEITSLTMVDEATLYNTLILLLRSPDVLLRVTRRKKKID